MTAFGKNVYKVSKKNDTQFIGLRDSFYWPEWDEVQTTDYSNSALLIYYIKVLLAKFLQKVVLKHSIKSLVG